MVLKRILLYIVFLAFNFPVINGVGQLKAQKYRWPLNINNGYSSTFFEFRSNHLHAGLDLRTFQKPGYPVYAISDGHIFLIRKVKRGSGNGLYLKHTDGFVSKYFHLERFNDALTKIARQVRLKKNQKYFGNYYLEHKLPVKRGELIGFSGESGSGFPHLHLELRDRDDRAVNPLSFLEIPKKDHNRPVFKSIIVRNSNSGAINNQIGELFLKFNKMTKGFYQTDRVFFSDSFELTLNALDISDTGKYVAPYQIQAEIDGKPFFGLTCQSFQWDDNNQLGFVYDMEYSSPGSPFFNIYFQKGFGLEQYQNSLHSILKNLSCGPHSLKISLKDYFGNKTLGIIPLVKYQVPRIELSDILLKKNQLDFKIKAFSDQFSTGIKLRLLNARGFEKFSGDFKRRAENINRKISLNDIDGSDISYLVWDFFHKGQSYFQEVIALKKEITPEMFKDLSYSVFINNNLIFLKLHGFKGDRGMVDLRVGQAGQVHTIKPLGGLTPYFVFNFSEYQYKLPLNLRVYNQGKELIQSVDELELIGLKPGKKTEWNRGGFFAQFGSKSVKNPKVMQFKNRELPSIFPQVSNQIDLGPYNFPFLDKVIYGFKIPQGTPKIKQLGIFRYDQRKKKWRYKYSLLSQDKKHYSTRLLHSGIFSLMRDEFPPDIYLLPVQSLYIHYLKAIVVKITDRGKGIDDRSLDITINGCRSEAEYDPDWQTVRIVNLTDLKKGPNLIRVSVKDYGNNNRMKIFKINLK